MSKIYLLEGVPRALGDSGTIFIYNLLPVGKFYDKRYGEVWISSEMVKKMAANFGKYPAYEVPIKFGHGDDAPSPGKVIAVEAKPEGLEITFMADKEASQEINNKRYRYMSAEFEDDYMDKKTGEYVGPVLVGAALVNQPADPWVEPLILSDVSDTGKKDKNKEEKKDMDLKDIAVLKEELKKELSEDFTKREEKSRKEFDEEMKKQKELSDAQAKQIEELKAQNKTALDERTRLQREKHDMEVKAFSEKWTSAGIPPAVFEKLKPILAEERVIRLSDTENKPMLTLLSEIFEALPQVQMGQSGKSGDGGKKELFDYEKSSELAKKMAEYVNRK